MPQHATCSRMNAVSLTRDHVIDWVRRYGKAWQEQSVPGILELFTEAWCSWSGSAIPQSMKTILVRR